MLRAPVYLNAHVAEYLRQRLAQTVDVLMCKRIGQPYIVDGLQILMNEGLGLVDRQKAGIDADGQVAHAERATVAFSADEVWHLHYSDGLGTDLTRPWPGKDHRLVCASHHAFSFSTGIGGAGARRGKPGRRRDRRTNRRSTSQHPPHLRLIPPRRVRHWPGLFFTAQEDGRRDESRWREALAAGIASPFQKGRALDQKRPVRLDLAAGPAGLGRCSPRVRGQYLIGEDGGVMVMAHHGYISQDVGRHTLHLGQLAAAGPRPSEAVSGVNPVDEGHPRGAVVVVAEADLQQYAVRVIGDLEGRGDFPSDVNARVLIDAGLMVA